MKFFDRDTKVGDKTELYNAAVVSEQTAKTISSNRHVLVPQPSNDPTDPLNWPRKKKYFLFAIMCLATFSGICVGTSPLLATTAQAKTFQTTPIVMSYTLSGTIGGLLLGPLIFIPLARVFGMSSISFWCLVLTVAMCIWSGEANNRDDFLSYAVSRGLAGVFCVVPQILTGGFILNVFFLHERGKMYAIYSTIYTLATVVGASFCGFIVQHATWPVNFWWLAGANGLAAVLIFCFMEETGFDRIGMTCFPTETRTCSWAKSRVLTFLPGSQVVPSKNFGTLLAAAPFIIGASPVTILAGLYSLINFTWFVTISIQLSIFLQEPYAPAEGFLGYGLSAQQTALFYFALWIGILVAQAYGIAFNDSIPLGISRRHSDWHPEYRLHTAWIPGLIVMPIGLGIFGAALAFHLHYMVSALGSFLVSFGGVSSVPVSINYIIESFEQYPQEVGASLNVYRLAFALAVPFFFPSWTARIGIGWVFGMMAFFSVLGFLIVVILMFFGRQLRKTNLLLSDTNEEAVKVER